ncbi:breast cancer type 2 susceptibility protein [Tenrec ecaudatus]|uniref:breast cancer type 2 susceptibility protein n=1 Tax=Tenrec ecaudatus TaxID=94439 RepID=UPI003F5A4DEF
MLIGTKEKPTFFEIFKARCSKADLGPISLNWFEELSLEAPPYKSEPAEESEYKISSYEPNHFKTPQRKLYNPLASTPVIFKDQGKETANSKQRSRLSKRARVDPAKDVTSPPPDSCLSGSPLLRAAHVTPQRAKSVVCGNLFHTPKLLKGQTPKRISESLGAEVDPDMSWSSSLATPPTLSSTVLIAREQEVSERVFPSDATVASKEFISSHNESLKKNDWLIPSGSDNENKNQREVISYDLEETLGNVYGDVNSHQDHSGRSVSNVIDEEVADISEEDSFSLCVRKYKTGKLQKIKTRKTRGKMFNKTKAGDCEEAEPQLHGRKHLLSFEMEPSDSDPCDSSGLAQEPTGGAIEACSQELRASPASGWPQPMLSGLNGTRMTKMLFLPDPSFDQKDLGKDLMGTQKGCATLGTAENSPPHLSNLQDTEEVLNEDPVLKESNKERCLGSHQDVILPAEPTVSGTSPITSLQRSKKLVCSIQESPKETSGAASSGYVTDPSFREKPGASAGGLGADIHCSQKEGPLCASSAASRSCPATTRPASAILKSAGLISTLKQKTRKFVYSVSHETAYPEEQIQRDEDPEPPHCPAQVGAPCSIPDSLHSPVKRNNLQSRPEEPTLSSCVGPILRKSSNHESSSTNKIISQDLNDKEIELNTEELESFITTESDSLSRLQESYCEEDPKSDRRISNVREMVLAASCRPAIECGSVHLHSQESFLHDCNTSTLILTPSPKEPLSSSTMISRESKHNISEATLILTKNFLIEKNQEISILNDNSQIIQLSPPEKYLKVTSPSLNFQFDQNTNATAIPKDQEEITFTSEVTVCSNSEELFPENKDDFVFQVTREENMAVLEDAKEHRETSVSCVKEPVPKHPTVVTYSDVDAKQELQHLAPQDSNLLNIGLNLTEEARKSEKQYLKMTLSQDSKTDLSLEKARKCSRDVDDDDSCAGLSYPISNFDFGGGFRTASNKEIKLSEHHIKKSKALFKDIEEQYPKSLAYVEVVDTLLLDNQKKGKPHAWDPQTVNIASGHAEDHEKSHTIPFTLSLKQDLYSNHNLTPSQKAEITELSTILEQSGSQFEFTQFGKPDHRIENHTSEKCENQVTISNHVSEGRKDVDVGAPTNAPLTKKVDGSKKSNGSIEDKPKMACLLKNDCNKSTSGYLAPKVEFTGFCSALGTKINVSSEALQSVRSLFSDIEDTSAEGDPQSFSPSKHSSVLLSKRKYLNNDEDVNMKCHLILQNNMELTTGIFVEGNTRDWKRNIENEENKCTGARRNTSSSGKSADSDSSKTDAPGIYKDESGSLSTTGQHNVHLKLSSQLIKEGNNEKEDLSDLTCLEVVKPGEIVCVDTQAKDQATNKMRQNVKDFDMCNLPFQTASGKNIRVSKESFKKVANLFREKSAEEELSTFSDLFDSELPSGTNMDKSDSENKKMVKNNVQKGNDPTGIENKLLVLHQQPKCEIGKTREPAMLGFHTASGKKVKIAKESLDKVKNLFDEKQDDTSKIFSFHSQGAKTLEETGECTEGLQLETVEVTTLPKSEEMENLLDDNERNFVHNETTGLLTEPLDRHTESLKTSSSISLKVEVHQNLEKETAKSPTMCCTASENPAFAFCTGRGRKISVSQASLFDAKKWLREGELEDQPVDISTAKAICLKECPQDWVGNLPYGSSSDPVITENDKQNLSYLSNNYSYSFDFCHSSEVHNKSGSLSKNKIDCSGIVPVMKNVRTRKYTTSISEITPARRTSTPPQTVNENVCVQKLRTDAPCKSENAAIGFAMSGSSDFEVGLPAFSTASGKRVSVSRKAVERAREILADNSSEVVKPNTERQSDSYKTRIVGGSCCRALDDSEDDVFPSSLDGDGGTVHKVLDAAQSEQSSQHNLHMSALVRVPELPPGQVNGKMSGVCKFSIGTLPKSTSSNVCGIFSTASGKSVQVSDASLRKARQVFSEIENRSEHNVSKASFKSSEEHSNKFTGDKNNGIHTKAKSPPPPKSFPSKLLNLSSASGFSTASGKQVLISESALNKVKGMLEEFDLITAEYNPHSPPFISAASDILPLPCIENIPKEPVNSKEVRKTYDTEFQLLNIGSGSSESTHPLQDEESPVETKVSLVEKSHLLGKAQTFPRQVKMKIENAPTFSNIPIKKSVEVTSACSKDPGYFETEAVEIAKAFMEDDELTDLELPSHAKHSQFTCAKPKETVVLNSRTGKRRNTLVSAGEPPTKRSLLNEFDRIAEKQEKSLQASKCTPDGTMKDRRLFMHHISLNPITCVPFCTTKEQPEVRTPRFSAPGQQFLPRSHVFGHSTLEKPSSSVSVSGEPLHRGPASGRGGARAAVNAGRTAKVFVPPFKTKSHFQKKEQCAAGNVDVDENAHPQKNSAVPSAGAGAGAGMSEDGIHPLDQMDSSQAAAVTFSTHEGEPLDVLASLQIARDAQEARIRMKQQQRVCPQPGSLYLAKTSSMPRVSLRAAVGGRAPATCSPEQLYVSGVPKHCAQISSRKAAAFQFCAQDYFGKEAWAGRGIQLADGGWLIPSNSGQAGKEEFYRALCDTPGVDPRLISQAWVSNHYRWIVWKLAAMEVSFPKEFANRCLHPERVLLQLKYRYDVEVDRSSRSAIRKITERDDTSARTLVLCISEVVSPSPRPTEPASGETRHADGRSRVILELTDGWYAIRAQLDPPLSALLKTGRLAVGHKVITHGAELVGAQDACPPLEAPASLLLKISANSTRPARWYTRLGFFRDPRPFPLPLSSLFSDGGNVGCVDVVVQRVYPVQWVEKTPSGLYVFRDERTEEKEAARNAEARQKRLEALLTRVQAELKEQEETTTKRCVPSRALTRQQVHALQDGAELYEAVRSAPDPGHLEGHFSDEQRRALSAHRQMLNDKRQAQVQLEFEKAVESVEAEFQDLSRDVTTMWKLRVTDYRKKEKDSVVLSVWRPSSELFSMLTEGTRCRIYHLTAAAAKRKAGKGTVQLTATKKTQYQPLPASEEILSQVYKPREPLDFHRLLDPAFQPPCSEVDLMGWVVSVVKRTGLAPVVYLSDEHHNLLAIKFWVDLNEDTIKPSVFIAASNLQWRPESKSRIPTLFAGEFSTFSANPKESYFQEASHSMQAAVEDVSAWCDEAKQKLLLLLEARGPEWSTPSKGPSVPSAQHLFLSKGASLPVPIAAPKTAKSCGKVEEDGNDLKTAKKRRALDFLSRLPAPPPVSPVCTFVSRAAQKAFHPPRRCGTAHGAPLGTRASTSPQMTPLGNAMDTALVESNSIADEELALINTQALLCGPARETPSAVSPSPPGQRRLSQRPPQGRSSLAPCPSSQEMASTEAQDRSLICRSQVEPHIHGRDCRVTPSKSDSACTVGASPS